MLKTTITAAFLSLVMVAGSVLVQAQTPAPGTTDKKAISTACSDQANAKNLHGKARKKFRSECKKNGGKLSGA